jgi:hypothetical protein
MAAESFSVGSSQSTLGGLAAPWAHLAAAAALVRFRFRVWWFVVLLLTKLVTISGQQNHD